MPKWKKPKSSNALKFSFTETLNLIISNNPWMLSIISILNKTDKSSIEPFHYCKIDVKIF